ncbi:MAG: helix-turn-helix transcriptional regulator [Anaerotignum sp.]|nr:helix-turn-helix transcriptional regulator [Anaerotignum sp.]
MDKIAVGKRLRRHREKLGFSREQFAEQISISPQFLAEIENGKKGMSAETLYKICENYEGIVEYLLLGRQSVKGNATPAVQMLSQIPPQYSEMIEDVLRAFIKTIEISNKE